MAHLQAPDELLTIDEAEHQFGVSRATLYRYIQKGKLQNYHREMDRRSYLRRAELEKLRSFESIFKRHTLTIAEFERMRDSGFRMSADEARAISDANRVQESPEERTQRILAALDEAAEFRRRVFGDRFVSVSAAEVIEEARRERSEQIG